MTRSSQEVTDLERFDAFISYSHDADGRLAPAVQSGLQRLAKRVFQRRALRVFRDETGLSINPHLWGSIESAIDASDWFVLLASPDSAASEWVDREVAAWLERKPLDHVLIVVTDGHLVFRSRTGVDSITNCLPPSLAAALDREPRWLDLRWARDHSQLDLRNGRFRAAMADLAAPIHGMAKDDLEGDDVRQQQRARRLATGGVSAVALLAIVSTATAFIAVEQRREVAVQRDEAERQRTEADTQRASAEEQQAEAEVQRAEAQDAARRATARSLAAQSPSVLNASPSLGLLIAAQGYVLDPVAAQAGAIAQALDRTRLLQASVDLPIDAVESVIATSDNQTALVVRRDNDSISIDEWSIDRRAFTGASIAVGSVSTFSNAPLIASRSADLVLIRGRGVAVVLDTSELRLLTIGSLAEMVGASAPTAAAWTPDGRSLVIATAATLDVISMNDGSRRTIHEFGPPTVVDSMGITSNGEVLLATEFGVQSYAIADGSPTTPAIDLPNSSIAVNADGNVLVLVDHIDGGGPSTLHLIDVAGAVPRPTTLAMSSGFHPRPQFAGDDAAVVLAGVAGTRLLDTGTMQLSDLVAVTNFEQVEFAAMPDGRLLTVGSDASSLDVWDLANRQSVSGLARRHAGPGPVQFESGEAVVQADGELRLLGDDLEVLRSISIPDTSVLAMAIEPTHEQIALVTTSDGTDDLVVTIVDHDLNTLLSTVVDLETNVVLTAMSPDLRWLSIFDAQYVVTIVDTINGDVVYRTPVPELPVFFAWDSASRQFQAQTADNMSLRIVAGLWQGELTSEGGIGLELSEDPTVRIGQAQIRVVDQLGLPIDPTPGSDVDNDVTADELHAVTLIVPRSRDLLVTENGDGTYSMWTWPELEPIAGQIGDFSRLGLERDARGWIEWQLSPAGWFDSACERAGRNLSQEEWARYVGGEYQITCPEWPAGA